MMRDLTSVTVDDLTSAARLFRRLPPLLRHPLSVGEAQAILSRRLERREPNFVSLVQRAVFDHPTSPYRALLHAAGVEFGDLEQMVRGVAIRSSGSGGTATTVPIGFESIRDMAVNQCQGSVRGLQESIQALPPAVRLTGVSVKTADGRTFRKPVGRRSAWHKTLRGELFPEPENQWALDPGQLLESVMGTGNRAKRVARSARQR